MPDISAAISKLDNEQQIVFGWAYVSHDPAGVMQVDKSGDFLTSIDELEKSAYDFVLNSRDGGDTHIRKGVSTMVESMVFTPEKIEKMGLPAGTMPTGWWVGFKVHDDEVWKAVKEGRYRSFSIHGSGVRKKVEKAAPVQKTLGSGFRLKELLAKHGDKGEPGYRALHPNIGFSGGATGAGQAGGKSKASGGFKKYMGNDWSQTVDRMKAGGVYRRGGVTFKVNSKKKTPGGYQLKIQHSERVGGTDKWGSEKEILWPPGTDVTFVGTVPKSGVSAPKKTAAPKTPKVDPKKSFVKDGRALPLPGKPGEWVGGVLPSDANALSYARQDRYADALRHGLSHKQAMEWAKATHAPLRGRSKTRTIS